MSRRTLTRVAGALNPLAVWQHLPVSSSSQERLGRLNAMLATYSGLDNSLMLVEYGSPLVAMLVAKLAALQLKLARRSRAVAKLSLLRVSAITQSLQIISSKCSDARMLTRFFGLLPIFGWIFALETPDTQPDNALLLNVQRLQTWSLLVLYSLEHIYYITEHSIITMTAAKRLKCIMWACRGWALHTFLELFLQSRQARDLSTRMRLILAKRAKEQAPSSQGDQQVGTDKHGKGEDHPNEVVQQAADKIEQADLSVQERECQKERSGLFNAIVTNLAYAPLTIHWSLEQGLFANTIWESVFMSIAAVSGLHSDWVSTLPANVHLVEHVI